MKGGSHKGLHNYIIPFVLNIQNRQTYSFGVKITNLELKGKNKPWKENPIFHSHLSPVSIA